MILGAVVAVALLIIIGVNMFDGSSTPDTPAKGSDGPVGTPWTVGSPAELGDPVAARVAGDIVVVTARKGVYALSRTDGHDLWQQDYAEAFTAIRPEGLTHADATTAVTIAGDAVIVSKHPTDGMEIAHSGNDVLDLATGTVRFKQTPKTDPAKGWSMGYATTTSLITAECSGGSCELTANSLKDGGTQWTKTVPNGWRPVFPTDVNRQWETAPSAAPMPNAPWRVGEKPGRAVFLDKKDQRATVVSLADGAVIGEWPTGDLGGWDFAVLDDLVIKVGGIDNDTFKGIDPATGAETWTYQGLEESQMLSEFSGAVLSGGLLIDRDLGARSFRTVDPATGEEGPILGNRGPLLAVTPKLQVMGKISELTAKSPAGETLWTAQIEQGEKRYGEWSNSLIAGDSLAFTARVDEDGPDAFTWSVNLSTGELTAIGEGAILGYDDRALITTASGNGTSFGLTLRPI